MKIGPVAAQEISYWVSHFADFLAIPYKSPGRILELVTPRDRVVLGSLARAARDFSNEFAVFLHLKRHFWLTFRHPSKAAAKD